MIFLHLERNDRIPVYDHFIPWSFRSKSKELFVVWSELLLTLGRKHRIPIQLGSLKEMTIVE